MAQAALPGQTPNIDILKDVQGDVVLGFPKKKQELIFFVIKKPGDFKEALPRLNISSTEDVVAANAQIAQIKREAPGSLAPVGFLNIAFSKKGLDVLGVKGNLGDQPFVDGQLKGAELLGDSNTPGSEKFDPDWDLAYKQTIHGVLNAAGESWRSVNEKVTHAKNVLGSSIQVVHSLKGSVRPGDDKGREHFGWEDGISNPAVRGVGVDGQGTILPGQRPIDAGIILRGLEGDLIPPPAGGLPAWGVGGSFLAFRQIEQHVPEFHQFLKLKAASLGDPSEHAVEVLGAQLVGRWKSGAPIQRTPDLQDIPSKGKDKQWNNDFVYPQDRGDAGQNLCPYAAHIRKTNPRNDLDQFGVSAVDRTSVIRAGIPYGPELSFDEKAEEVTEMERGLMFLCYQSSINSGFKFMQESWANAPDFPPAKGVTAGFDPIIGQKKGPNRDRETFGTAADGFKITGMPDFIKSRGGEYFFAPTIPVLKSAFN